MYDHVFAVCVHKLCTQCLFTLYLCVIHSLWALWVVFITLGQSISVCFSHSVFTASTLNMCLSHLPIEITKHLLIINTNYDQRFLQKHQVFATDFV